MYEVRDHRASAMPGPDAEQHRAKADEVHPSSQSPAEGSLQSEASVHHGSGRDGADGARAVDDLAMGPGARAYGWVVLSVAPVLFGVLSWAFDLAREGAGLDPRVWFLCMALLGAATEIAGFRLTLGIPHDLRLVGHDRAVFENSGSVAGVHLWAVIPIVLFGLPACPEVTIPLGVIWWLGPYVAVLVARVPPLFRDADETDDGETPTLRTAGARVTYLEASVARVRPDRAVTWRHWVGLGMFVVSAVTQWFVVEFVITAYFGTPREMVSGLADTHVLVRIAAFVGIILVLGVLTVTGLMGAMARWVLAPSLSVLARRVLPLSEDVGGLISTGAALALDLALAFGAALFG